MPGENVCSVCGATFTRPQHVGRHMRSHTGDKPYHCKQCPEKFARSDLLSRHVNKTHGPPAEGEGKGEPRNGLMAKKKGRKPKFTSAVAAMSGSSVQPYRPPFSHQPQQRPTIEQQQLPQGQNLPYHPHSPFHHSFQQPQAYGFAQAEISSNSGLTIPTEATSSINEMTMPVGANQPNNMMYTSVQDNGMISGFEVDNEEDDDDAWIDMPKYVLLVMNLDYEAKIGATIPK
ncbi:hypothetical protein NCC49_002220 [Naganishia albida]|nr:hypothetical protein NCC49_002220 [Naganishia albida]